MMKDNKYDDSNENLRALTNTSPIVSEEEIKNEFTLEKFNNDIFRHFGKESFT